MVGPEVVSTVMARAGEHFEMPDGSTVLIMRATDETGGELVEMEFTLAPGAAGPPPHRHPEQVEEWEVLDGTLSARVDVSILWRKHRRMQIVASPLLGGGMILLAGLGRLLRFRMP